MSRCLILFSILIFFVACHEDPYLLPKARLYPKVIYPDRNISSFNQGECPFTFKYPDYFTITKEEGFQELKEKSSCWMDLQYDDYNCNLHFSYVDIEDSNHFDDLVIDAFKLVEKHNIKANFRDEILLKTENGINGLLFEIEGPVATPLQFFVTDTTQHFLRASLYFKSKVNRDSIAPVYNYVKEDILNMINSLEWKRKSSSI